MVSDVGGGPGSGAISESLKSHFTGDLGITTGVADTTGAGGGGVAKAIGRSSDDAIGETTDDTTGLTTIEALGVTTAESLGCTTAAGLGGTAADDGVGVTDVADSIGVTTAEDTDGVSFLASGLDCVGLACSHSEYV